MRVVRVLVALLLVSGTARAQTRVVVTDLGPGPSGRILQAALAQPHRVVEPDTTWFELPRSDQERATIIVLGRNAAIARNVEGSIIVVGGDLFVRPGARISGRGIAIGGGTYPSTLAIVEQGTFSFRDNTFQITRTPAGYELAYQSLRAHETPPLLLPGVFGLRLPRYDRVNGLSQPFGPALTYAGGRGQLDALVTYRSDLGAFDPSVETDLQLGRRLRARIEAGRGTFSNDDWIRSDLVNSFNSIAFGRDVRNYYRADPGEATIHSLWELTASLVEPFVGVLVEEAWSVGPFAVGQSSPWSVLDRTDSLEGMVRPNPAIVDGRITSALVGASYQWEAQQLRLQLRSRAEIALQAPQERRFQQLTSDLDVSFPAFTEHEYEMELHWVTTFGDTPPPQRFGYLGGSGTLPFLDLLEQGGDEVLLPDQRYSIPLPRVRVGILGELTMQLRHRLGSAGISKLPSLEQVVGVGAMLTFIRAEVQVDPATGDLRFSTGFSFSR